jgi:hypothetical protein
MQIVDYVPVAVAESENRGALDAVDVAHGQ